MITVTSTTNAPGTTIQVHYLCIDLMMFDSNTNISIRLLDSNKKAIQLPQPVRAMTAAEKGAIISSVANAGETIQQLITRACAPYISAVYGITYATV